MESAAGLVFVCCRTAPSSWEGEGDEECHLFVLLSVSLQLGYFPSLESFNSWSWIDPWSWPNALLLDLRQELLPRSCYLCDVWREIAASGSFVRFLTLCFLFSLLLSPSISHEENSLPLLLPHGTCAVQSSTKRRENWAGNCGVASRNRLPANRRIGLQRCSTQERSSVCLAVSPLISSLFSLSFDLANSGIITLSLVRFLLLNVKYFLVDLGRIVNVIDRRRIMEFSTVGAGNYMNSFSSIFTPKDDESLTCNKGKFPFPYLIYT